MDRSIIHLNIADFAVAVETSAQPSLKGYPVVIAPLGASRAVVYDMSEEAYKEGIRKGMALARAQRINNRIKLLPPRFNLYEQVMKALLKETIAFTPLVESGTSDGHIFLDVSRSARLFGPSVDVAFKLKKAVKKTFNFDLIWSVATNKLVAKVATRIVKPVGEYIVAPGEENAFLGPLSLHLIPGLIKTDLIKCYEFNLFLISQARRLTLEQLKVPFNSRAPLVYDWIRGIDQTPVTAFCQNDAILMADHAFSNDTNSADQLRRALYLMVEQIGKPLRNQNRTSAAANLILSYSDGLQTTSKLAIKPPTSNDYTLFKKCIPLLNRAWRRRVRVRHMRLICNTRVLRETPLELFAEKTKETRQAELIGAMDKIRQKFGHAAITPALTLIDNDRHP